MIALVLIVSGILTASQAPGGRHAAQPPSRPGPAGAAERVTLKDGSVALGMVTSVTNGSRGSVELLVRRDWARAHLPNWAPRWERAIENGTRLAARQRSERLAAWRQQRVTNRHEGDRILGWIDQETKRLADPARSHASAMIPVHLPRNEVRSLARQPRPSLRLLQLGWLCGLPDVESMSIESLRDAVEGRGFAPDGDNTPSLNALLPLTPEPELDWLARRAATELALDSDLKFVRHQGLVFPDMPGGQGQAPGLNGLNLSAALGELNKLLDPEPAREDPLVAIFNKIGESGRVGVLVTRLEIPADLTQAAVESTLWVRAGAEQWVPYLRRSATVRLDEIAPDDGRDLAEDPQVKTAFSVVEGLGLGKIPAELKERSLKMGASTQKALGTARAAIGLELNRLMLPIFEPGGDHAKPIKGS
jgi:hypothetical protein